MESSHLLHFVTFLVIFLVIFLPREARLILSEGSGEFRPSRSKPPFNRRTVVGLYGVFRYKKSNVKLRWDWSCASYASSSTREEGFVVYRVEEKTWREPSGGVKELEHRELKKKTLRESERRGESKREKLMFRATLEKHGGEALREISN